MWKKKKQKEGLLMDHFSLGQKNLHFPFSCLITSFLSGCSFKKNFASLSLLPTENIVFKQISQRVYRTDYRLMLEGKIIVHEPINVAGRTP